MEIHEKIRNLREDADLKQEEVARYLGITRPQYSLYETGKREFKLNHIKSLCLLFHISADAIFGLPQDLPYSHSKTRKITENLTSQEILLYRTKGSWVK